jgi:hypothetical protein
MNFKKKYPCNWKNAKLSLAGTAFSPTKNFHGLGMNQ